MSEIARRWVRLAHVDRRWLNPVPPQRIEALLARARLPMGAQVADLGCGKGELLIRLAEELEDVSGFGIDELPELIADARAAMAQRVPGAGLLFRVGDVSDVLARLPPMDLCACIGAYPFGESWFETLEGLRETVRPGGLILASEGFAVDPEAALSHGRTFGMGAHLGLEPLGCALATPREIEAYDRACADAVRRFCARHPADPDVEALEETTRRWEAVPADQERSVAGTALDEQGYGIYLFRRPG